MESNSISSDQSMELKIVKSKKKPKRRTSVPDLGNTPNFVSRRKTISMATYTMASRLESNNSENVSKNTSFHTSKFHQTQNCNEEIKKIKKSKFKSSFLRKNNETLPQLGTMVHGNRQMKKSVIKALAGKFIVDKPVYHDNSKEKYFLEILKKKPKSRSQEEINSLTEFLSNIEFFKKYINDGNEEVVGQCSSQLRLEVFKPGEKIMKYGEFGDKFYIILQGS